jgi:hypothetical protein
MVAPAGPLSLVSAAEVPGRAWSLQAGGGPAAGVSSLLAGAGAGGVPVSPGPGLPRLPAVPGGANGGSGSGSGAGAGGSGGGSGGVQGGIGAGLIAVLVLVLLRLARRAGVPPVWRSYLPEVSPA